MCIRDRVTALQTPHFIIRSLFGYLMDITEKLRRCTVSYCIKIVNSVLATGWIQFRYVSGKAQLIMVLFLVMVKAITTLINHQMDFILLIEGKQLRKYAR